MASFNQSRFNLVLCEIHYTPIHGKTCNSFSTIEGHYLLIYKFDGLTGIILDDELEEYYTDEEDNEDDEEDEDEMMTNMQHIQQLYERNYAEMVEATEANANRQVPHKLIRNYHNIISRVNYIKPEIAECFELPTGEYIAIIKTFWIKIIQRKWKKVYAVRQDIIKIRSCLSSLYTRQITGKWPDSCIDLPGLKGMLKI